MQLMDESGKLVGGEMQPVLAADDAAEVNELLEKLKGDIVESLVSERIRKATAA